MFPLPKKIVTVQNPQGLTLDIRDFTTRFVASDWTQDPDTLSQGLPLFGQKMFSRKHQKAQKSDGPGGLLDMNEQDPLTKVFKNQPPASWTQEDKDRRVF